MADSPKNSTAPSSEGADQRITAGHLALELMHEIKNPLETLGNLMYLVSQDAEKPERVRFYMSLAEEQISTLSKLTTQALGFARLSDVPQPIDLVDIAEAALRIHGKTIEAKRIHLVKKLPGDLLAQVHSGQILQVVSNLLANALEALPEQGTLSLRIRKGDRRLYVTVADTGSGIQTEDVDQIFEPFFTTKGEAGSGLGLSLSKRIIEAHGGHIRVRSSVRQGRTGTTFRISMPHAG